jgi:hypothetical protein
MTRTEQATHTFRNPNDSDEKILTNERNRKYNGPADDVTGARIGSAAAVIGRGVLLGLVGTAPG